MAVHSRFFLYLQAFLVLSAIADSRLDNRTRMIAVSVGGLVSDCINSTKTHKAFDRLQSEGSYTFEARSSIWANRPAGLSTILCGMDSEDSGILDDSWTAHWLFNTTNPLRPKTGLNAPLPCIFKELKSKDENSKIKFAHSYDFLVQFGKSSIKGSIDEEAYCLDAAQTLESSRTCDQSTRDKVLDFIKADFDFIYADFGSVDRAGRLTGYCSNDYLITVQEIDAYLQKILLELTYHGIYDSTYVLVTSDHGGERGSRGVGVQSDEYLFVPLYIRGPNVRKNSLIEGLVRTTSIAPTVLGVFGHSKNPNWRFDSIDRIFTAGVTSSLKFLD